ncbi:MAG: glycerol-3-phosphate dehydrogenase [Rhodobacterales bacterium]|nr:glycerol-3-phosphate dehydrogenase [Rhodobacterales bacterium]
MSERMTNVEIEDVLASIRRLVSEDGRTAPRRGAGPDKLVLTSALRVVGEPAPPDAGSAAQPEEPVAGRPEPLAPEPEVLEPTDRPEDLLDWHDDPTPAAAAEVLDDTADPEVADFVIDEEALREMVRDILREELQGALGERITRNVRKLVRAEIARALTTRDFDTRS